jgi:hypothetical protein
MLFIKLSKLSSISRWKLHLHPTEVIFAVNETLRLIINVVIVLFLDVCSQSLGLMLLLAYISGSVEYTISVIRQLILKKVTLPPFALKLFRDLSEMETDVQLSIPMAKVENVELNNVTNLRELFKSEFGQQVKIILQLQTKGWAVDRAVIVICM